MTSAEHTTTRSPSVPVRGGLAVVLAVFVNVVFVLGVDTLGIAPAFRALAIPPVAFLSALGASGATVVYWLLGRYASDADRKFVRVAAGVLLLSVVPDVALLAIDPAATLLAVVILVAMHVVVATVSVGVLVFWGAEQ
ncbi:DUF6069 family protein [Halapricum desulfuricans]|uniref:Putative membrane protein n=1 Tax=Halapricum desulfuricans TaxID=2841257 RepID=A0A897MYC7_9EURY|nr:DUF6069 family protein [Halapricum desulfuricans]QSG05467.1 putative membrane protein [Halapricum desulfuricans]